MTDIIIPLYNEETLLKERASYYERLGKMVRIIFVDGGSSDKTAELAARYGQVVLSPKGRSLQMNEGVKHSESKYLLFLHADTFIDFPALDAMNKAFLSGSAGGCFCMRIEESGLAYRLFEWVINFRARCFGIIDGDLGLFISREMFDKVGQYDPLPVMEDLLLSRKMKKETPITVLRDPICVSGRKWRVNGFVKTFIQYTLAYIQLWTGFKIYRFSHELA